VTVPARVVRYFFVFAIETYEFMPPQCGRPAVNECVYYLPLFTAQM
jgi:hypothetical protein